MVPVAEGAPVKRLKYMSPEVPEIPPKVTFVILAGEVMLIVSLFASMAEKEAPLKIITLSAWKCTPYVDKFNEERVSARALSIDDNVSCTPSFRTESSRV